MKKLKFFAPVMATVAALTPVTALLTSCGKVNYTEFVSEIKDSTISIFMDLAKTTHRAVWDEGEVYDYIKKQMTSYGFSEPSGEDYWSEIPEVKAAIIKEIEQKYTEIGESKASRPLPGTRYFADFGNMWYDIPATEGYENVPKLIISAHMDSSMAFNDTTENPANKEKWIKATTDIINVTYDNDNEILKTDKSTSLGADDGLGVAMMLSVAKKHKSFKHGAIRLLFTAGESETTTNYASGSDFLLNDQIYDGYEVDAEGKKGEKSYLKAGSSKPFGEKGEFPYIVSTSGIYKNAVYTSSAGIHDCEAADYELNLSHSQAEQGNNDYISNEINWDYEEQWEGETTKRKLNLFTLSLDKLHGGQSGKYINDGYASALQMMGEMLFTSDYAYRLIFLKSRPGNRAIPTQGEATFATLLTEEEVKSKFKLIIDEYKVCFPNDNWEDFTWDVKLVSDHSDYKYSLSPRQTRKITNWLAHELEYGPIEWFDKEHTKVKTSCNFCDLILSIPQTAEGAKKSTFHMHNVCRSADIGSLYTFHNIAETITYDALECLYEFDYDATKGETPYSKAKAHTVHMTKPVWERSENNKIANLLCDGFRNLGIEPIQWENHGWVEIACVPRIYESAFQTEAYITCVGPEIRQSHEVDEEVWTDTLSTAIGAVAYVIDHVKNI